jgi:hypothetical protein
VRWFNRWRLFSTFRYTDPSLHPGVWSQPSIAAHRHHGTIIKWTLVQGGTICAGSNHGAHTCTIGPGMSHVDTCSCGAKRYGIFGEWQ